MNLPMHAQATAPHAALKAVGLRMVAQAQIVNSFRAHLEGGPEPSDDELILFARSALSEMRVQRRAMAISSQHEGHAALCSER
ncbi:hypothetical protein H4CHR_05784 [Variovorax sp. PBS-H4]|uniref:hypothetical protein n=1 Tax=Variovorax sp. PBS-H4 TaxID=434008 RepID=UPI0013195AE9|nr:hypothetical protein [Variovorax sp. PBS-H4]VTU41050.1 hypothetical protein H4CHR_05784 [Variovorax sp. PBS-H4]